MARSLTRRRLLRSLSLWPLPVLVACGGAPGSPTKPAAGTTPAAAATKPAAEATKPSATTAATKPAGEATKPAATAAATKPAAAATAAATAAKDGVGAAGKPLRMAFVPSADSQKVLASGRPLGDLLAKQTGLTIDVSVPTSYAAVIEGIGAGNVDVAWLAPFSYVLANQKFGAQVILASVRNGSSTYRSQIITHVDSGISSVEDLKGKRFAFVDSASASGYLYPAALIKEKLGGDPQQVLGEVTYAGGHDKVVIAVYNRNVDAGATFGNSVDTGDPTDARTIVTSTLPDVLDKVKVIATTDPIPNDTVSVRKDLAPDIVAKVKDGLLAVSKADDGKKLLRDLYRIDGLAPADNASYDTLRRKAQAMNFDIEETIKPAPTPTPKP